jgi:hypothetical protein
MVVKRPRLWLARILWRFSAWLTKIGMRIVGIKLPPYKVVPDAAEPPGLPESPPPYEPDLFTAAAACQRCGATFRSKDREEVVVWAQMHKCGESGKEWN